MRRQATSPVLIFSRARRGSATIEFAFTGLAFFLFVLGLINFGDLAVSYGILQTATAAAARAVSLTAASDLGNGDVLSTPGNGYCTALTGNASSTLVTSFNTVAAPLLPRATGIATTVSAATAGPPVLVPTWNNYANASTAANAQSTDVPGSFITVTATYLWKPPVAIGLPSIPLRAVAVAPVSNSNNVSGAIVGGSYIQCP